MVTEKTPVLNLRKPIMNGYGSSESDPAVGVAHRRLLNTEKIKIVISYRDKQGQLVFPYEYEISCAEALQYTPMTLPDGCTIVHVIPIRRLTQLLTKYNPSFKEVMKQSNKVAKRMANENNLRATIEPTWD
jgi:hypothetical protein